MPKWGFKFIGYQLETLRVDLDIHGHKEVVDAFVDTGFMGDVSGIKVPASLGQYARYRYTSSAVVGHGEEIPFQYIPDGKIQSIDGKSLNLTLPVMFMDGPQVLGCYLLAHGSLSVNGRKGNGKFKI